MTPTSLSSQRPASQATRCLANPPAVAPIQASDSPASLMSYARIAIAVGDGAPINNSKTAISLIRYRGGDIVAIIDAENRGRTAQQLYGVGGEIPVVASLAEVDRPDSIFVGIAPAGGEMPDSLRRVIAAGVDQGLDIISGLHDFLVNDPVLSSAAQRSGSRLIDVRRNTFHKTGKARSFREGCLRIHAVGHDCSVGKMVTTLELERGLRERNIDARFLATGQTGIMVVGEGVPVDCVVSDFVNGAVEDLVLQNEQHDILLIEGQGSITHPAFSAVTLGLLHGCAPQGMILCYEAGRTQVKGLPHVQIASLERYRDLYESLASERCPSQIIGVAVNGRNLTPEQAEQEKENVSARLGLPVCDVYRDGPDLLVDAVLNLREQLFS
ncbi:DUF1611 domain-containing protein [Planctomicrobium sp. SH664]|uniref:DUF1611 domain-containing protein n=1 Tax=Planctomicrobium sp. SH664 TaxID=3448125 RepID=UPI003F5CB222